MKCNLSTFLSHLHNSSPLRSPDSTPRRNTRRSSCRCTPSSYQWPCISCIRCHLGSSPACNSSTQFPPGTCCSLRLHHCRKNRQMWVSGSSWTSKHCRQTECRHRMKGTDSRIAGNYLHLRNSLSSIAHSQEKYIHCILAPAHRTANKY